MKSRSGIDLAISRALRDKKQFNERRYLDQRIVAHNKREQALVEKYEKDVA